MKRTRSKYRNKKTVVKGIKFDSKLESHIYLKILELKKRYDFSYSLQPRYTLVDKFSTGKKNHRAITYIADFDLEIKGQAYTVDSKAIKTDVFRIKEKLFALRYKREIICVKSVKQFTDWFMEIIKNKEEK